MDLAITQVIKKFLLPPSSLIILFLIAALLWKKKPKVARNVFFLALFFLTTLSLPIVSNGLIALVEIYPALDQQDIQHNDRQAIVVLGGGSEPYAPEYGKASVSKHSLIRLRYAAYLHKETQLPILVSGGNPKQYKAPEARLIANVLTNEMGTPVKWQETKSRNTAENALFSAKILKPQGITRIYLVTQAWHLRRAVPMYEALGFDVVAAPTGFEGNINAMSIATFIPSANALSLSSAALHELLGIVWYSLRY